MENTISIHVDMSELDEALKKAKQLKEALLETNELMCLLGLRKKDGEDRKGVKRVDLSAAKTLELVKELKKREGVLTEYAEPHEDKTVSINGPAYILVVVD